MRTSEILEKNKCAYLRILLVVYICLRHMGDYENSIPLILKQGFLMCGIFFMLSGFGLMQAYKIKGEEYLQGFFKRRIMRLIIPLIIVFPFFAVMKYKLGILDGSIVEYIRSVHASNFIISYSWYIYIQIFLYILFFFEIRKKNNQKRMLIVNVVMVIFLYVFRFCPCYFLSTLCFNLGIYFGTKDYHEINCRNFALFLVLFILMFILYISFNNYYLKYSIGIIVCLLFAYVSINVLGLISVKVNKYLLKLSSITYECYICQGIIFITYYKLLGININVYINCIICLCMVFICGYFINLISNKIYRRI